MEPKTNEPEVAILPQTDIPNAKDYEALIQKKIENLPSQTNSGVTLERSDFFRYPEDAKVIEGFVSEKILAGEKVGLLEIGVGNFQELSSYLAAIKKVADLNGKTLQDCVSTEIVELKDKESVNTKFSFGKSWLTKAAIKPPENYPKSFYFDEAEGVNKFTPDIQEYVIGTISNPGLAHFSTSVEDYLAHSEKQVDIVACNNVLQYLGAMGLSYNNPTSGGKIEGFDYTSFDKVLADIAKRVKEGGLLIMHVDSKGGDKRGEKAEPLLKSLEGFSLNFKKIAPGVFQRNKTERVEEIVQDIEHELDVKAEEIRKEKLRDIRGSLGI